jgi:hypothetical protein
MLSFTYCKLIKHISNSWAKLLNPKLNHCILSPSLPPFFLLVPEFKLRTSQLLGRLSISWSTAPVFLAVVTLEIGSSFLLRLVQTLILLFYASHCSWEDRHTYHAQLFSFEMGVSQTFFCPTWPETSIFLISASQVARIKGKSHYYLAWSSFLRR